MTQLKTPKPKIDVIYILAIIILIISSITFFSSCMRDRQIKEIKNNIVVLDSITTKNLEAIKNYNEISKRSLIDYRYFAEKFSLENLILEDNLDRKVTNTNAIVMRIKVLDGKRDSLIKELIK